MLVTLEIDQRSKDAKTLFKYLRELSYVKIVENRNVAVSEKKAAVLKGIEEAVAELNLVLAGKKDAQDAEEFIKSL